MEGFSYQEKISLSKLRLLASNFSTVFAVAQGLPGSLPWGVLLTFLNDFLSQHKGMTTAEATLVRRCCPEMPGLTAAQCSRAAAVAS